VVRVADHRHSLRRCMMTMTRSTCAQFRCAVYALWSEHHSHYAQRTNLTRSSRLRRPKQAPTSRPRPRSERMAPTRETGELAYSTVASSCVVISGVATPGDPEWVAILVVVTGCSSGRSRRRVWHFQKVLADDGGGGSGGTPSLLTSAVRLLGCIGCAAR
jgi:hypothetical protein